MVIFSVVIIQIIVEKNKSQQRQGKQKNSSVTDVFNGFFLKTIHLKFYLSKMNSTSTGHMLVYSNSILTKLRSFQQERFCDSQEQTDSFWFNPMLISVFVVECFRYNQNCVFLYQKQTAFTAYFLPEIVFSVLLCPKLCFFQYQRQFASFLVNRYKSPDFRVRTSWMIPIVQMQSFPLKV